MLNQDGKGKEVCVHAPGLLLSSAKSEQHRFCCPIKLCVRRTPFLGVGTLVLMLCEGFSVKQMRSARSLAMKDRWEKRHDEKNVQARVFLFLGDDSGQKFKGVGKRRSTNPNEELISKQRCIPLTRSTLLLM